ncbi:ARM repeat-containing protein [Pluteus cervinus]|uniref:ARM repeat-containing protein n=1 Tax=Pluteus cervinus TaxID=181527 RepID=A0ACD3B9V3_9AGAR|nr:ARM repeat-containing protein [Pluteus cervinus]
MDVPFISSGASSRAHYALVRKVETADSAQAINRHLSSEIELIRQTFASPSLSTNACKELLIVLLYCAFTTTSGEAVRHQFDFALTHAVNLAETGRAIGEKRIGYLFCAELMPPEHELRLMLVNTLRKDLESPEIPRICLALESLIAISTEDFIPAVQSRLLDLLSHNSPHVRRRALFSFQTLSRHDSSLSETAGRLVFRRLRDQDPSVVNAALVACSHIGQRDDEKYQKTLKDFVSHAAANPEGIGRHVLLRVLNTLAQVRIPEDLVDPLVILLRLALESKATIHAIFLVLAHADPERLLGATANPVQCIRHLLVSDDPNDRYLFVSCLECVDHRIWSGTTTEGVPVLEAWEVERIMAFLDSDDDLLHSYYSQVFQGLRSNGENQASRNRSIGRLLEVLEVQSEGDGEAYARRFHELFTSIETERDGPIAEIAVEQTLSRTRDSDNTFRLGLATTLLTLFTDEETVLGPTSYVILSALGCEFCGKLSITPTAILRKLSTNLAEYNLAAQEAALLSMTRICAECDKIPDEVIETVNALRVASRRHIRKRCDDLISLGKQPQLLKEVLRHARSSSLPDFAEALNTHRSQLQFHMETSQGTDTPPPLTPKASPSKLRYSAYDTPPAPKSLREARAPDTLHKLRGESTHDGSRASSRLSQTSDKAFFEESLLTLGAGRLSLSATTEQNLSSAPHLADQQQPVGQTANLTVREDLIAFDTPTMDLALAEPDESPAELFAALWNSLSDAEGGRGWCEMPVEEVIRLLQTLEGYSLSVIESPVEPFPDDLKVLLFSSNAATITGNKKAEAAVRLRESEGATVDIR